LYFFFEGNGCTAPAIAILSGCTGPILAMNVGCFRAGEPNLLSLAGDRDGTTYILNGTLSGDRFYVHAYNDNNGRMVVTRIGL
jgi:hypothetical protein